MLIEEIKQGQRVRVKEGHNHPFLSNELGGALGKISGVSTGRISGAPLVRVALDNWEHVDWYFRPEELEAVVDTPQE